MWEYNYTNELSHFGVLGMKWGRRTNKVGANTTKKSEKEYKDKLGKIVDQYDKPLSNIRATSDLRRIKYRNRPLAARIALMAKNRVIRKVIGDYMSGEINKYQSMDKKQIAKEILSISAKTALDVVIQDRLAKSASDNYTDSGHVKKGVNTKTMVTKEDVMSFGAEAVRQIIPVANWALKTKYTNALKEKEANRRRFEAWGSRILPEKVSDTIWID